MLRHCIAVRGKEDILHHFVFWDCPQNQRWRTSGCAVSASAPETCCCLHLRKWQSPLVAICVVLKGMEQYICCVIVRLVNFTWFVLTQSKIPGTVQGCEVIFGAVATVDIAVPCGPKCFSIHNHYKSNCKTMNFHPIRMWAIGRIKFHINIVQEANRKSLF